MFWTAPMLQTLTVLECKSEATGGPAVNTSQRLFKSVVKLLIVSRCALRSVCNKAPFHTLANGCFTGDGCPIYRR